MIAVINRVNYMIEQYRDSEYTNDGPSSPVITTASNWRKNDAPLKVV